MSNLTTNTTQLEALLEQANALPNATTSSSVLELMGTLTITPRGNEGNQEYYLGAECSASGSSTGNYMREWGANGLGDLLVESNLLMIECQLNDGETRKRFFGAVSNEYQAPVLPMIASIEHYLGSYYLAQEVADTIFETGTYNTLCYEVTFTGYKLL